MDKIEILGLDLFDTLKDQVEMVERVKQTFNMGIGWHYYLDLAWIVNNVRELPPGSLLLDAGAGTGLLQFLLAELGYNVISVDFANRQFSKPLRERYGSVIHYLNDQSITYDNTYTRHLEQTYKVASTGKHTRGTFPADARAAVNMIERLCRAATQSPNLSTEILCDDVKRYCGRIFVYKSDLRQMTLLPDGLVDAVVSVSALEHNNHEEFGQCMDELLRVTKSQGFIAATVHASLDDDWFHDPSKGWCYSETTLKKFFRLPESVKSNYADKERLFSELKKENNELHKRLASFYFQSGDNGMPWGKWDPKYQPVGVLKIKGEDVKNTDEPLVSFIIPCYNASPTLEATLNSVLLQEYKNYEVIMIDDGSTDNTPEIIKKYESYDVRFRSFRQSNQGVSGARNKGAELAKGELLAFLDADDILYKNSVSERVKAFVNESDTFLLGVFCPAEMIFSDGKSMGMAILFDYPLPNDRLYFSYTPESVFNPSCVIVKRTAFVNSGGFDVTIAPAEDYDLWHRMMRTCGYFKIVRSCKIGYTQHPESAVRSQLLKHYHQWKRVSERIFFDTSVSISEYQKGFGYSLYQKSLSTRAFCTAIMAITSGQSNVADEVIRDISKYAIETMDASGLESRIKFAVLRTLCKHEREWKTVVWPQVKDEILTFISNLNNRMGGDCYSLLQLKKQLAKVGQADDSTKEATSIVGKLKRWMKKDKSLKRFSVIFILYTLLLIFFTICITVLLLND